VILGFVYRCIVLAKSGGRGDTGDLLAAGAVFG
jgi:hypothetical protein